MPSSIQPTPEQTAIIDAARRGGSLMVSAYAGTAKTTSLVLAAPAIREPALALAFNKKIAEELKPKLPPHFSTRTLNSLGHVAWSQALRTRGISNLKLDDRKLGKLITQTAKDNKIPLSSQTWTDIKNLVQAAQLAGIDPSCQFPGLAPDTPDTWRELFDGPSSEDFDLTFDLAHQVLLESNRLSLLGTISFDDQIYCPVVLGGQWPQFPTILVDESQDLSPLNHRMLQLALRPSGRLIAVGDSRQAIYAFRGADASSMSTMRSLSPSWTDLQLTVTFRCPHSIVARQQAHAPGYTAHSSCPEGRVGAIENLASPKASAAPAETNPDESNLPSWSFDSIKSEATDLPAQLYSGSGPRLAVLCRNNAPLLSLAFKLLRRNIGCQMLGRDIGKGLIALSKKLSDDDSEPITRHIGKLREWETHEADLALANEKPEKADAVRDKAESLAAVAEGSSARTAGDLRSALERLFDRTSGIIQLSTIHRAKGLEWDLVIHLDPWRLPSKQAQAAARRGNPIPLQQEKNLLYVCETRTRHTLLNLNLGDFK